MQQKTTKSSPLDRLALDGFQECAKARNKVEKVMWVLTIVISYTAATYLTAITVNRYFEAGRVVDVQEHPKPAFRFPDVMVCPTAFFNKSFCNERIKIPKSIEPEFANRSMSKSEIVHEFARYLRYFNPISANTAGNFEQWKWDLLTQIYDYNFKDQEFADFVSDAALKGKELLKKCEYEGRQYPCGHTPIVADTPSCYILLVEGKREIVAPIRLDTAKVQGLSFELSVSQSDVVYGFDSNDDYETKQLGTYLYLSNLAGPFSPPLTFPSNTHAVVELQSAEVELMSDCYRTPPPVVKSLISGSFYSRDMCLFDWVQNFTKRQCDCYMIGGIHFPRNKEVCTPRKMKDCVLPMLSPKESGDYSAMNERCKPLCTDYRFWSTISYYNIETADDERVTNRFTIFYYMKRQFLHSERSACNWYEIWSNVGGLIGVYTGASVAGMVQAIILLSAAIYSALQASDLLRTRFPSSTSPLTM